MTQPTQAQIEAAKALHRYELERGYITREWGPTNDDENVYLEMAEAALAAAAEADIQFRKFGSGATWVDFPMTQESAQTTPTQAQIEAAANALYKRECNRLSESCPENEWGVIDEISRTEYKLEAAAALNAAAEVGDKYGPSETEAKAIMAEAAALAEIQELKNKLAATIERCAQVVEQYDKERGHTLNSDIAAAIRAVEGGN